MAKSIASLLGHLQHAKGSEFNDAIREFLDSSFTPDKAVAIILRRMDEGHYILDDHLVSLIERSSSPALYARAKERLHKNPWAALKLYRVQYPDPDIEKHLCSRLYEIASDDGDFLRRAITEAMGDVGSEAVLPTLEAIFFDLEPGAKVQEIFSSALEIDPLSILQAKSRSEFVKIVAHAIEAVENRVPSIDDADTSLTTKTNQSVPADIGDNARRYVIQARRYSNEEPETAIFFIRKGAEALSKDLYRRLGHEQKGKPAKKMMLGELSKMINESTAPDVFKILIQAFQLFGNFASHDQDDQRSHLTKEMASAICVLYEEAISVYSRWLEGPKGI